MKKRIKYRSPTTASDVLDQVSNNGEYDVTKNESCTTHDVKGEWEGEVTVTFPQDSEGLENEMVNRLKFDVDKDGSWIFEKNDP